MTARNYQQKIFTDSWLHSSFASSLLSLIKVPNTRILSTTSFFRRYLLDIDVFLLNPSLRNLVGFWQNWQSVPVFHKETNFESAISVSRRVLADCTSLSHHPNMPSASVFSIHNCTYQIFTSHSCLSSFNLAVFSYLRIRLFGIYWVFLYNWNTHF